MNGKLIVVDHREDRVQVHHSVVMWDRNGNHGVVVRILKEVSSDVFDGVRRRPLGNPNC